MKQSLLFLASLLLIFTACQKDKFDKLKTSELVVNVLYPETYSELQASGATVTITNMGDGSVKSAQTVSGKALFADMLPGTYTLSASKNLNASEAAQLTGIAEEVSLNAIQNNAVVSGGANASFELKLKGSTVGGLVFKEVYYTGSKTSSGGMYFSDQFMEIYNNATDTIYLDSLCIADVYGVSGLINPNNAPSPFQDDKDHVYANSIWRIPGSGKEHPLAPGESIIIAQDGVNHKDALLNPNSPVDLSKADWETYNERPDGRDLDAPEVPNLERVYFTGGFDWLVTVFGPGLVIFKADFTTLEKVPIPGVPYFEPRIKIPNAKIIDAFEALKDGESGSFKRIPEALDAGFVFAKDTYTAESFRRKTSRVINGRRVLQDTNNSSNDFEKLSTPTPKSFK